ncbi:hypothetical protein J2858_004836 [Neorhizobium galegae]|nr:hypothetical protein [Neorhizobium galegae]
MCRDVSVSFRNRNLTIMPEIASQFSADR